MSSNNGTRLYVGKLSSRTRDRDLTDRFSRYGRVLTCDLKYGYAFVEFSDSRDAEDAVSHLNGSIVDGARIVVEFSKGARHASSGGGKSDRGASSRSEFRVAVENLPRDMSWQDLKDRFRQVGDVVFADVFPDRSGRVRGIVEFRSREDIKDAIRKLDGVEIRGNAIYVREDEGRGPRGGSRSPPRRQSSSSASISRRSRSPPRRPSPRRRHSRSRSPRRERRSRSPRPAARASPIRRLSRSPIPRGGRSPPKSPPRQLDRGSPPPRGISPERAHNGGGSPKGSPIGHGRSQSPRRSRSRSNSRSPVD